MRKYLAAFAVVAACVFLCPRAHAYDNLCANNPDPTARIHCWQNSPAYGGLVPAQAAARCPDKSTECFVAILLKWNSCLAYSQSSAVAYTNTPDFSAITPPQQWAPDIQNVDATLTVPVYGPQSMKVYYPRLIAAQGFGKGWFGTNPAEAQSYVMNMCLDDRLF
jgi:hypothetical protein